MTRKANWFRELRLPGEEIAAIPAEFSPHTTDEAYLIQQAIRDARPGGAWKLGGVNEATQLAFDTREVYYGFVEPRRVFAWGDDIDFEGIVPLRGEVEIALRLGPAISNHASVSSKLDLFDLAAPCLEMPWSRIKDVVSEGLTALVADNCGAGFVILGESVEVDSELLESGLDISILENDTPYASGSTSRILSGPLSAAIDFVEMAISREELLEPGQWISTGGCTDCVNLLPDSRYEIRIAGFNPFSFDT